MNVLYCGDKNIADGVMISVLSLNECVGEALNVYILTSNLQTESRVCEALSPDFAEFLEGKIKHKNSESSVELIDISELFKAELPLANLETRFTPCCMLRLFADLVPSLPDRLLYLDNDVICRRDCTDMYYRDMTDCDIAGVLDHYGKWFFRRNIFKADYINSGVLLLNMALIRQNGLFAKCRRRCAEKQMFMPDQSALNKLSDNKKQLPRRYNEQRKLHHDTVFQHFTTSFRFFPWLHAVSVKPWDIDRMHEVLRLYEYDSLLSRYRKLKEEYEKEQLKL
jgi:lipopolysaccharide biosynthesis glycosyltransferase